MTFAPFPPAPYLSDGSRTEGEMKTAFENWLLATKQTSGHGQCRLVYSSPTTLALVPFEGRRVLVNDRAYEIAPSGLAVTNAGLLANRPYYVVLVDTAGVVALALYDAAAPSIVRMVDPDSGVSMLSGDGGTTISRTTTVVGVINTNATAQFTDIGTCSLHGRLLKVHGLALTGDMSGGSATNLPVLGANIAAFWLDTVQCHGALIAQTQVASGANIQANGRGVLPTIVNAATWSIAANSIATLTLTWPIPASTDQGLYGELGFTVSFGAPITVKVGSTLYITRLA